MHVDLAMRSPILSTTPFMATNRCPSGNLCRYNVWLKNPFLHLPRGSRASLRYFRKPNDELTQVSIKHRVVAVSSVFSGLRRYLQTINHFRGNNSSVSTGLNVLWFETSCTVHGYVEVPPWLFKFDIITADPKNMNTQAFVYVPHNLLITNGIVWLRVMGSSSRITCHLSCA